MSNVIDLKRAKFTRFEKRDKPLRRICRHYDLVVEEHTRTVSCDRCNAVLDPFAILKDMADGQREVENTARMLRKIRDEMAELKKEERNLKARIRRHQSKIKGQQ